MSKVRMIMHVNSLTAWGDYVEFEGANVSEVLAMRAEYLLNVGVEAEAAQSGEVPSAPTTTFLSRTKGEVT